MFPLLGATSGTIPRENFEEEKASKPLTLKLKVKSTSSSFISLNQKKN